MKFFVHSFGCKVNQVESEYFKDEAFKSGFCPAKSLETAELLIINSCAVTETAVKRLKTFVRKMREKSPKLLMAVTGCGAELEGAELKEAGADLIITNTGKYNLFEYILKKTDHLSKITLESEKDIPTIKSVTGQTRAFVMIQEGCDANCSYCIIPELRGAPVSKTPKDVLEEIDNLVFAGYKEIVPVGIHIGKYGVDLEEDYSLLKLLKDIEKIKGDFRLRLTSIEVNEIDDEFISFMKESKKICPHLHIPLQSGSDNILKKMNRHYTSEEYINTCKKVKYEIPEICIGADVITGFPSETDEEALETISTIKSAGIDFMHVFPYSDRPGTPASEMEGKIDENTKRQRALELRKLGSELKEKSQKKLIGKIKRVLTEKDGSGLTDNYHRVYYRADMKKNLFVDIEITGINKKGDLEGDIL